MSVPISVDKISVSLGGHPVLDQLSLEVAAGEFVTLLGASGSGKTTTLSVIAGLVRQSTGSVRIGGADVSLLPPEARDVGVVFQSYALFPHLSVAENVAFPLRARRVPGDERARRVDEALDLVQLSGFGPRPARRLSGGQQQRVALARALVFRPRLLLLDEPLAALDEGLRRTVRDELRRIQAEVGVTTVAVTHDQAEAMAMSDRVALLHEGRIAQVGTPEDLYRRPDSLYVASFLGEATIFEVIDGVVPALEMPVTGVRQGVAVLRPEALGIVETGARGHGAYPAHLRSLDFEGSSYRAVLDAEAGGAQLLVTVPAATDVALVRPGARCHVTCIDPSLVHLLAHRPAAEAGVPPN
ncbi:MAG: ABC transporter ATP-binding protein [Candidatus Dormibacteria bacterium]